MLDGDYNIVKIYRESSKEIVETSVSSGLASLMEAAARHGGNVLTPRQIAPKKFSVTDELGNRFIAV